MASEPEEGEGPGPEYVLDCLRAMSDRVVKARREKGQYAAFELQAARKERDSFRARRLPPLRMIEGGKK